jgi:hypothetical protein
VAETWHRPEIAENNLEGGLLLDNNRHEAFVGTPLSMLHECRKYIKKIVYRLAVFIFGGRLALPASPLHEQH